MSKRIALAAWAGIALAFACLAATPTQAEAQFGKRLKERLKQNAEDKAINKAVDEQNKAIDKATSEDGGGGEAGDSATAAAPSAPAATGGAAAPTPAAAATPGQPTTGEAAAAAPALKAGEGAFVSFDFVPGDRVLFYDDLTTDNVGDFPRRLEFMEGNAEVADWQGGKWLRVSQSAKFAVPLPETMPARFTVEFDYVTNDRASRGWQLMLNFSDAQGNWESQGNTHPTVRFQTDKGSVHSGKVSSEGPAGGDFADQVNRARIMADGKYTKVYINGVRVANAPNADVGRSNKIQFWVPGYDKEGKSATLIGPIRVAAGGKKLYDALTEKGRVATQGIYFDTGSDRIRQESSPTLKEIGTMLKDHPELKLLIEGHTDNVGQPAANQALSEKRAAAVRQYLVDNYQIDGGRLQAKGLGQTKPAGSNDTPEGKQGNRRVELVKI